MGVLDSHHINHSSKPKYLAPETNNGWTESLILSGNRRHVGLTGLAGSLR